MQSVTAGENPTYPRAIGDATSRAVACGWVWHYDGVTLDEYARLEKEGTLTLAQRIWREGLRSFLRLRPEFVPPEVQPR